MRFCKRTLALLAAAVMALALPACTSAPAHSNGPTEFASTEELASYVAQQADAEENQIALFEPQVEEAQLQAMFQKETAAGAKFLLQADFGYGGEPHPKKEAGKPQETVITVEVPESHG